MSELMALDGKEYRAWIGELKKRYRATQIKSTITFIIDLQTKTLGPQGPRRYAQNAIRFLQSANGNLV